MTSNVVTGDWHNGLGGFAFAMLLMMGIVIAAIAGAISAALYLAVERRLVRGCHYLVLGTLVVLNVRLAMLSPDAWADLIVGRVTGQTRIDYPILTLIPLVPYLLLFAFSAPVIRRIRRRRARQ